MYKSQDCAGANYTLMRSCGPAPSPLDANTFTDAAIATNEFYFFYVALQQSPSSE